MSSPKHTIQTLGMLISDISIRLGHLDEKVDLLRTDQTVAKLQVKVDVLMYVASIALASTFFQVLFLIFKRIN